MISYINYSMVSYNYVIIIQQCLLISLIPVKSFSLSSVMIHQSALHSLFSSFGCGGRHAARQQQKTQSKTVKKKKQQQQQQQQAAPFLTWRRNLTSASRTMKLGRMRSNDMNYLRPNCIFKLSSSCSKAS